MDLWKRRRMHKQRKETQLPQIPSLPVGPVVNQTEPICGFTAAKDGWQLDLAKKKLWIDRCRYLSVNVFSSAGLRVCLPPSDAAKYWWPQSPEICPLCPHLHAASLGYHAASVPMATNWIRCYNRTCLVWQVFSSELCLQVWRERDQKLSASSRRRPSAAH